MMKTCKNCGQEFPIECFPKRSAYKGGVITWCRTCHCNRTNEKMRIKKIMEEMKRKAEVMERVRFACANC